MSGVAQFKVSLVNLGVYAFPSIQQIVVGFIISCWALQAYTAERTPVLIEFFNSQEFSSCPLANALLRDLSKKPNVVVLAFHVDFQNFIVWKRSLAESNFSTRQKTFAQLVLHTAVYTPQFMIKGQAAIMSSEPRTLKKNFKSSQKDRTVLINLRFNDNQVQIDLNSKKNQKAFQADVLAVYFIPEARVAIRRDEISGCVMHYSNIMTKIEKIGKWNGQSSMRQTTLSKADQNLAFIVQLVGRGKVIVASELP